MSARGGSRGKRKRGKKPNKKIEVARALEATIPKTISPVRLKALLEMIKLGPDDGTLRSYLEERGTKCFLCEVFVPYDDVRGQFCHGCLKLICDKHVNAELPIGGHDPSDHRGEEDENES